MGNARIVTSGWYVPEKVLDNSFFVESSHNPYLVHIGEDSSGFSKFKDERVMLDESKILEITGGMKERRVVSDGENTVDMIEKAFRKTGFDAKNLDGIIVASISDNIRFPSNASRVQKRICARESIDYAADVAAACSGFTHALDHARLRIMERGGNYLVAGVETLSRIVDYSEINCDLFGDGCGVVVLSPCESDVGILTTSFFSDVSGVDYIYQDRFGKLRMPSGIHGGLGVMKKAVRGMIDVVHRGLDRIKIGKDDVDFYIPHQANGRIVKGVAKRVDSENSGKVVCTYEKFGNISSAAQPVAYAISRESGKIKRDNLVVWTGVGSGLSYGAIVERV